jgi:DNA-binding CsgD family transcriptional regulator
MQLALERKTEFANWPALYWDRALAPQLGIRHVDDREHAIKLWNHLFDGSSAVVSHAQVGEVRHMLTRRSLTNDVLENTLNARDRRTMLLAALGSSTKELACELEVADSTASILVRSVLSKLGVASRTELIEVFGGALLTFGASEKPAMEVCFALPARAQVSTFRVDSEDYTLFELPFRRLEPPPCLTHAEREVVRGVFNGMSNAEIAQLRHTSINTVANQLRATYVKLGISGRSQLIAWCWKSHARTDKRARAATRASCDRGDSDA